MTDARAAIAAIYVQVGAPDWAATNLDGLADVLRDLSWRGPGPVEVEVGEAPPEVLAVVERAAAETAGRARPVRVVRRR
jgi:hypothetical protein